MRKPLSLLLFVLLVVPAMPAGAQPADRAMVSEDAFTVSGIAVDVTAENAVAAREQALERGQREGLARLLRRLAPAAEHGGLPSVAGLPLERYVRNFEVADERLSTTRYIARLAVTYEPAAVRDLLRQHGAAFAEVSSEPLLVLPLFETPDGGLHLWQEGNPWWQAWARTMDREGLLRLSLPLGDLEDERAIAEDLQDLERDGAAYAPAGERPALRRISDRYDAHGVIVAHAQVDSGGEAGQTPVVTITAQGFGDVDVGDVTTTVRGQPDQSLEQVLVAAVARVQDALSEGWKQAHLLRFDRGGTIRVNVPLDSLQSWVTINQALRSLPQIGEVEVEAFSRDAAWLRIAYYGDMPRIQAELAGLGLFLTQEAEGDSWLLLRAGADPRRGTPFEATPTAF